MRRLTWLSALCGVALIAAACSSGSSISGQSPAQIISAVKQALASASSVRITGTIEQSGMQGSFDLTTFSNGDLQGTITESGESVKLVSVGKKDYLYASKSFWSTEGAPAQTAQTLANKWVYGTQSQVGLGDSFSLPTLSSQITKPQGKVTKGATGSISGQAAQSLHSTQGTLWVALNGTTYPIELTKTGSGSSGVIHFSAWNSGTTPTAPAGAESLDSLAS
jgi:hypothetical protein